jgi:hypothetical protein
MADKNRGNPKTKQKIERHAPNRLYYFFEKHDDDGRKKIEKKWGKEEKRKGFAQLATIFRLCTGEFFFKNVSWFFWMTVTFYSSKIKFN